MKRFFGVFTFAFNVLGMAKSNTTLLKPILYNLAIATPLSLVLAVAYGLVSNAAVGYAVMFIGVAALYFTDYFSNGLTASLITQQVTTGQTSMDEALTTTKKAIPGIMMFAAISALFDLLVSFTDRRSLLGKIVAQIVYMVWTTATYVVMPAMVIEGLSFGQAFSRSKELMKQDPTQVGSGVLGIGIVNWVINIALFYVAYLGAGVLSGIHPIVGGFFFFFMFNLSWAITGYLKITYFTCFYLWAKQCEEKGSADIELAPAPLASALR
ncbi:MAG: DUF6159 family protein [Myxococcaceae bacterium]